MVATFSAADASILTGVIAGLVAVTLAVITQQDKRAQERRARLDQQRAELSQLVHDLMSRVGQPNGHGPLAQMVETLMSRQSEIHAELRAQRSELDVGLQRQSIEHAQTAAKVDLLGQRFERHVHEHAMDKGDGR